MRTRSISIAALFGIVVFISKVILPSPLDKTIIVVQGTLLELGFLLLGFYGATFVALVGGVLTALFRPSFFAVTLAFAILYGLLTDVFSSVLKVKNPENDVNVRRVIVAVATSTIIVGLASYLISSHVLKLLPRNPLLEATVLVAGVINGVVGGYLAAIIWRKALHPMLSQA